MPAVECQATKRATEDDDQDKESHSILRGSYTMDCTAFGGLESGSN